MKEILHYASFTLTLDPTDSFEAGRENLIQTCGVLPIWVCQYIGLPDQTIKDHMEGLYGFGTLNEMKGGTVEKDLGYNYPEDEPLNPLIHIKLKSGAEFVQYEYAICAMRDSAEDQWFITRMD